MLVDMSRREFTMHHLNDAFAGQHIRAPIFQWSGGRLRDVLTGFRTV